MRDFNRISVFCEELRKTWEQCPDLRFGQLVVNMLGRDPFYIEDDMSLEIIKKYKDVLIGDNRASIKAGKIMQSQDISHS